jgi:hypothetical protein
MVTKGFRLAICGVVLVGGIVVAFSPSIDRGRTTDASKNPSSVSSGIFLKFARRSFVETLVATSISVATIALPLEQAFASGGATAGGAYLLSAKQRYNERVTQGVKGFLAIGPAVESGDIDTVRAYFNGEEIGSWKDLSVAGYLLANAFRRNSSAAPDTLPSVKVSR